MAKMQPILPKFMLVMFGLGAGLALLEISLHLFPALLPRPVRQALAIYQDIHQTSDTNRPFKPDPTLIYAPRPGIDVEIHDGLALQYTVHTRSLGDPEVGFRDAGPITPTYAAAVGDSFTWGTYVEAEQTWPEQLQAEMGQPVVNLGVLGYGPIQYQLVTEKYALPLKPQVVLWGLFSGNDFVNSTEYVEWVQSGRQDSGLKQPETGLADFLARNVRLYELTKFFWHAGIYYQRLTSPEVVDIPAPGGPDWSFYPDILERQADSRQPRVAEGWQLTRQALLSARREVQAAGAQLVVVIIPPKELIYWDTLREHVGNPAAYDLAEPIRALTGFCQARQFLCLDLTPPFLDYTRTGQELYFRQDAHLNSTGYYVTAHLIAQYLRDQNLQP